MGDYSSSFTKTGCDRESRYTIWGQIFIGKYKWLIALKWDKGDNKDEDAIDTNY